MDRTTGTNNVEVGGKRQFTDGPPATTVDDTWLNAMQEEIVSFIESAGLTPDGSDLTQLKQAVDLNGIPDQTGGNPLLVKVIEIGDWDMNANLSPAVRPVHGITLSKIRSVTAMIRNDAGTAHYVLDGVANDPGAAPLGGVQNITTNILLIRTAGGQFDDVDFDSIPYNRGWVMIMYEAS